VAHVLPNLLMKGLWNIPALLRSPRFCSITSQKTANLYVANYIMFSNGNSIWFKHVNSWNNLQWISSLLEVNYVHCARYYSFFWKI
jgi:hypothetical protein